LITVLTYSRVQILATVFCAFIIAGLFTSSFFRILPSIGIAGLTITAIVYAVQNRQVGQRSMWNVYLALTSVFILHLMSGLNTQVGNKSDYWRDILLQSPFLLLPLSFWLLPPIKAVYLRYLWALFFALVTIFGLGSTINYLLNAEYINETYLHSRVMPTEPDHIRFSLMISLAVAVGCIMTLHKVWTSNWSRWLVISGTVFLAFYQHLLAVRSGLITFYALSIITTIWLIRAERYKMAVNLSLCLCLLPILSFVCFPTFRNRFHNTREDIGQVDQIRSAGNYSLTGRVYSYKVAMLVVKANPWLGVGNVDMQQELAEQYKKTFPTIKTSSYIKPHNQFIYSLVAFGILGVVFFIACFYYPLIWAWSQSTPLLIAHYCIITLSFLAEYTLETQIGLTFSLIFLLLALTGLAGKSDQDELWTPV
jgi:O-antigen ligase